MTTAMMTMMIRRRAGREGLVGRRRTRRSALASARRDRRTLAHNVRGLRFALRVAARRSGGAELDTHSVRARSNLLSRRGSISASPLAGVRPETPRAGPARRRLGRTLFMQIITRSFSLARVGVHVRRGKDSKTVKKDKNGPRPHEAQRIIN